MSQKANKRIESARSACPTRKGDALFARGSFAVLGAGMNHTEKIANFERTEAPVRDGKIGGNGAGLEFLDLYFAVYG
jgi:hypothetical protein